MLRLRGGKSSSIGRPTISDISSLVFVSARASNVSTRRPPRSTVIRSAMPANFFQPVRDEQDRYALGSELPNDPQQSAGFAFGQSRRRLIHDDHRHLQDKRAGNFNDLLLRRGQLSGHSRGIDCSPDSETIEDRSGPPFGFTSRIEHSAQAGLTAEENVLGNAEVGNDHQFLEDSDDPVAPGVGRRRKGDVGAVDRNRSGVGPGITAENADQRRLARAVLPNQRVDFAPAQNQRNIVQRPSPTGIPW